MSDPSSVYIGLCNPKSPSNVGAVLRAAGCYQADAVRYTGTRFARANKYCTDTKDSNKDIALVHIDDIAGDLPRQMQVVSVELVEGAASLPSFEHPKNAIYIFGPEDGSISQKTISKSDHVVYIPTKTCMNLAATVNVVLYDRLSKSISGSDSDHLQIKRSRDNNNRLVVSTSSQ